MTKKIKSKWDKPVPAYVWGIMHGIVIGIILSIFFIYKTHERIL